MSGISKGIFGIALVSLSTITLGCQTPHEVTVGVHVAEIPRGLRDEGIARTFVEELAVGRWSHPWTRFTPKLAGALPADRIEALWTELEDERGLYGGIEDTAVERVTPYRIVAITVRFARAREVIRVTVDDRGEVAGVFHKPAPPRTLPTPATDTVTSREDPPLRAPL
jgi:hypothetical protein